MKQSTAAMRICTVTAWRAHLAIFAQQTCHLRHVTYSCVRVPLLPQQACDRGTYLLVQKAAEVKRIGGQAMVLMNVPDGRQSLLTQDIGIDYIHLTPAQRGTVLAYVDSVAAATATLGATRLKVVTAPQMADFSSRGPIPIANAILMKPDITAPGEYTTCVMGLSLRSSTHPLGVVTLQGYFP